jgi:hypothetical protein
MCQWLKIISKPYWLVAKRSALVDFNEYLATQSANGHNIGREARDMDDDAVASDAEEKKYTAFQFWNFLDDALVEVRKEARKEGRTTQEQQKEWLST